MQWEQRTTVTSLFFWRLHPFPSTFTLSLRSSVGSSPQLSISRLSAIGKSTNKWKINLPVLMRETKEEGEIQLCVLPAGWCRALTQHPWIYFTILWCIFHNTWQMFTLGSQAYQVIFPLIFLLLEAINNKEKSIKVNTHTYKYIYRSPWELLQMSTLTATNTNIFPIEFPKTGGCSGILSAREYSRTF